MTDALSFYILNELQNLKPFDSSSFKGDISNSVAYNAGDYVRAQSKIYRATQNVPAGQAISYPVALTYRGGSSNITASSVSDSSYGSWAARTTINIPAGALTVGDLIVCYAAGINPTGTYAGVYSNNSSGTRWTLEGELFPNQTGWGSSGVYTTVATAADVTNGLNVQIVSYNTSPGSQVWTTGYVAYYGGAKVSSVRAGSGAQATSVTFPTGAKSGITLPGSNHYEVRFASGLTGSSSVFTSSWQASPANDASYTKLTDNVSATGGFSPKPPLVEQKLTSSANFVAAAASASTTVYWNLPLSIIIEQSDTGVPNSSYFVLDNRATSALGQVDAFKASGTWTKPANAKRITAIAINGGSGGQGGGTAINTTAAASGSAAGAGGARSLGSWPADQVTDSVTVTVGAGGAGGAKRVSSSSGTGNAGTAGGVSSFGALLTGSTAPSGNAGNGGAGAPRGGGGAPAVAGQSGYDGVGGSATTTDGQPGGDGQSPTFSGGSGGGGGGGSGWYNSGSGGGEGGRGGFPGGGGGGGGGHTINGSGTATGGAGGTGGDGVVVVITEF